MNRAPAAKKSSVAANSAWSVGLRLWIERRGKSVLGEGRADLLAAVERMHSISAAARSLKISYRHAWLMIQAVNDAAGEPLVSASIGGVKGGGAHLTERGRAALALYRELSGDVRRLAAGSLARIVQTGAVDTAVLRLAAAVSLQEAVGQILTEFALVRPQVRVHALFGASNELATQIAGGAPIDLFLSGDVKHLRTLAARRGRKVATKKIAVNGLAGIALKTSAHAVGRAEQVLARFERLAVADPATPLGLATQSFLQRQPAAPPVGERLIHVDNAHGVAAAIRSGRADLGIAFASDAAAAADMRVLFQTPPGRCDTTYYGAVTSEPTPGSAAREAAALLAFFQTPTARRCLRRCGLRV